MAHLSMDKIGLCAMAAGAAAVAAVNTNTQTNSTILFFYFHFEVNRQFYININCCLFHWKYGHIYFLHIRFYFHKKNIFFFHFNNNKNIIYSNFDIWYLQFSLARFLFFFLSLVRLKLYGHFSICNKCQMEWVHWMSKWR